MVNAVANSVVAEDNVICGGSFGAGNYAMCGKAYDPRFMLAWPTARFAVMSGDAAASTLAEIKLKQLEREGKKVDEKQKRELVESVRATYEHQTDPHYAAARLWVDAIIDPAHTRDALIWALEAAALNPEIASSRPESSRLDEHAKTRPDCPGGDCSRVGCRYLSRKGV